MWKVLAGSLLIGAATMGIWVWHERQDFIAKAGTACITDHRLRGGRGTSPICACAAARAAADLGWMTFSPFQIERAVADDMATRGPHSQFLVECQMPR